MTRRLPLVVCFVWAFAALGLVIGAWSLTTPLGGAPDEPQHIINAAAVVRGQLDEPLHKGPVGGTSIVTVPVYIAGIGELPACYYKKPNVSAACSPPLSRSSKPALAATQFSNYPPLYYLAVGIPTLTTSGKLAVYEMRLAGVLLSSALLALGLFLLARYGSSGVVFAGAILALSPMVFFVNGVINSSAMEISAGFASWCAALCLAGRRRISSGLAAGAALSFVLLAWSRPISPLYLGLILATAAVFAGWRQIVSLAAQPVVRIVGVVVVAAAVVAGIWLLVGGTPSLLGGRFVPPLSLGGEMRKTMALTWYRLDQSIGIFGWLDTPSPVGTIVIWSVGVCSLAGIALALSARARRSTPLLVAFSLAVPLAFESRKIDAIGPYWQGRYWLPILAGIPLLAAFSWPLRRRARHHSLRRSPAGRRAWWVLLLLPGAALLFVAQLAAFLTALHRYEVGLGKPPGSPVRWRPPGGAVLDTAIFVTGYVLLLSFCFVYGRWLRWGGESVPAGTAGVGVVDVPSQETAVSESTSVVGAG